ncbi:MAG: LPS assembly protein LptD [Pseudomonadota bacterium]
MKIRTKSLPIILHAACVATFLAFAGPAVHAQPASLIADTVTFDEESGLLTAAGNVEAVYEGRILRAESIIYDQNAETIRAVGPLTVQSEDGTVLRAEAAELSPDFARGLIESGQLLVAGQLQLAASEIRRTGERFTTLHRTVASSCVVCEENPTPTWSVRARRITVDDVEERIYFEGARFEVLGLPIAYFPSFSIPDPRITRSTGFLLPSYHQSDLYGLGFKIPYYTVLGPSSDATVTPFLTTDGASLLEGEYRRRFTNGEIDLAGVLALSDGNGDNGRGSIDSSGTFRLQQGFVSEFQLKLASDRTFLQEFDYSDEDRLTSFARVQRTETDEFIQLSTIGFQSLREDEDSGSIPFVLPEFKYDRRGSLPGIGGIFGANADILGITRREGRDVLRGGGGAQWHERWILGNGLVTSALLGGDFDTYLTRNDPNDPNGGDIRIVPVVSTEMSWPLIQTRGRATHVIEPIAQVIWSEALGSKDVPNEDSQLPELDETNLFSLNRFPGRDRVETGLRANLGVRFNRYDPRGWTLSATVGRVLRARDDADFPDSSGLTGKLSDYVGAVAVRFDSGLRMNNRTLLDEDLRFRRNEFSLAYEDDRTDLEASYVFFAQEDENPVFGPQPEIGEFGIEAIYRFERNWAMEVLWRYDVAAEENLRAGGGIIYGNECAEFELSVSRRFTSSDNLPPSTSIQFGVRLAGLGDGESRVWPPRACRPGRA